MGVIMAVKKVVREKIENVVDFQTGEITNKTVTSVDNFPSEPQYVKMYIEDLCSLKGVPNADQSVLRTLLLRLDFEGYVYLSPRYRKAICNQLDISEKTLRNRLASLVKANLIISVSRGEYMVNPNYFARGNWKNVCEQRKAFSLHITYSEKGKTIEMSELD